MANALIPNAAAITAARAVPAATTTRRRATAIGAGHEVTRTHAAAARLAHAGRVGVGDRVGADAAVRLALLPVAARDVDHSGGVDGGACDSADADADRAAFDGHGAAGVAADWGAVAGGGGGRGGWVARAGGFVGVDGRAW